MGRQLFVHKASNLHQGQMKPLSRSSAHVYDLAAMVVSPGRRADVSMDLPPLRRDRSHCKSNLFSRHAFSDDWERRIYLCGFRPTDGSQGHGGASFDARDRNPLGGISYPEKVN